MMDLRNKTTKAKTATSIRFGRRARPCCRCRFRLLGLSMSSLLLSQLLLVVTSTLAQGQSVRQRQSVVDVVDHGDSYEGYVNATTTTNAQRYLQQQQERQQEQRIYYAPAETGLDGQFLVVFDRDASDDDMVQTFHASRIGIGGIRWGSQRQQPLLLGRAIKAMRIFISNESDDDDDDNDTFDAVNNDWGDGVRTAAGAGSLRQWRQDRLFRRLVQSPRVQFIEQEQVVYAQSMTQQNVPSYGLDRLDQISDNLDGRFRYSYTGAGVTVYVVDTGIRSTHAEFLDASGNSRVTCGFNLYEVVEDCQDAYNHGTHVSAIIAGNTFGVAKNAKLIAVKIFDQTGIGSTGDIITGVDFIMRDVEQRNINLSTNTTFVANLSVVTTRSFALNQATAAAEAAGVVMTVAAGNDDTSACWSSPASSDAVLTVAASNALDKRASFSNYGPCVDMFAPGQDIVSAFNTNDYATGSLSGTSQAAPHVAGVAALYLEMDSTFSPAKLRQRILQDAVAGAIHNAEDSPNLLASIVQLNVLAGIGPTLEPSLQESFVPTVAPTPLSSNPRTPAPTRTAVPTQGPSIPPTAAPTFSHAPSPVPSLMPTLAPTASHMPRAVPTYTYSPARSGIPSTYPTTIYGDDDQVTDNDDGTQPNESTSRQHEILSTEQQSAHDGSLDGSTFDPTTNHSSSSHAGTSPVVIIVMMIILPMIMIELSVPWLAW